MCAYVTVERQSAFSSVSTGRRGGTGPVRISSRSALGEQVSVWGLGGHGMGGCGIGGCGIGGCGIGGCGMGGCGMDGCGVVVGLMRV